MDPGRHFAGAKLPGINLPAPNISSDAKDGIGAWTAEDVVTVLTSGRTPKGDVVCPWRTWLPAPRS